jgi:DNA-binding NarL/FixJ family response regulator
MKGNRFVTPKIELAMKKAFVRNPEGRPFERELTPRQREVLQLLGEGKSMKEAADILHVTPRTIAFHKYRMMDDFGIKTTADLIHMGIKKRILVA